MHVFLVLLIIVYQVKAIQISCCCLRGVACINKIILPLPFVLCMCMCRIFKTLSQVEA